MSVSKASFDSQVEPFTPEDCLVDQRLKFSSKGDTLGLLRYWQGNFETKLAGRHMGPSEGFGLSRHQKVVTPPSSSRVPDDDSPPGPVQKQLRPDRQRSRDLGDAKGEAMKVTSVCMDWNFF